MTSHTLHDDALRTVAKLSNDELRVQLVALVRRDHRLTAELLVHLGEVDARRLYLDWAASSLFRYCVETLGFSEDVAYKRIAAARVVRKFAAALDLVASGKLHLSGLLPVAPHLTPKNHAELLAAACNKSKRQVEMFLADRFPRPDAPAMVRRLPNRVVEVATRPRVEPLAPQRFRVTFTASAGLVEKLERARELASHAVAPSDVAALVERALDVLIAHEQKRRFAVKPEREVETDRAAAKPIPELDPGRVFDGLSGSPQVRRGRTAHGQDHSSRYVPAHVRRAVWKRDGGRCTFVDQATGRRCSERRFLELEHKVPHACGGPPTVDNLCLMCAGHNGQAARRVFGERYVAAAVARGGQPSTPEALLKQ